MRFQGWLILGVLAALMAASFLPLSSTAAVAAGTSTLYLTKHKHQYLLTENLPDKGARHVETEKIDPRKPGATDYKELGTWDSEPIASPSRIINLGVANLWLSITDADKQQEATVQVKVEVLQNGNVAVSRETGAVTLQFKGRAPTVINLPAPRPAIELAVGDVLGLRVSVRDGSAVLGGALAVKGYKVRLDYDGARAPSNLTFETAGPVPVVGMIDVGQPSFIDANGRLYITPETPIYFFIDMDVDINKTTVTASSPAGGVIPLLLASQGTNVIRLRGVPLGDYTIRVEVVTFSGETRSDILEVTLVDVLPQ